MNEYCELACRILRELCVIPAPSHEEDERVKYCLETLRSLGLDGAYADEAKNVILPVRGDGKTVVFEAHTDVVFPDKTPLPFSEDNENIYCPGCGDDTVAVALLIAAAKKLHDEGKKPKKNVVFVLNSCEEGLGNLKGTRAVLKKFPDTDEFYTFDGRYGHVVDRSVGSHRYRVTVKTEGGHSFNAFGKENAARVLAEGISLIYKINAPQDDGKTTYNVGLISGGTSVNSIVQEASMLCEYRSESYRSLEYMKAEFEKIFDIMRQSADVTVELVGERPCMKGGDEKAQRALADFCVAVQKKHTGGEVKSDPGSTDCNVPHSLGIAAVCAGVYDGGGAHTREEWLKKDSIPIGFDITCDIVGKYFE